MKPLSVEKWVGLMALSLAVGVGLISLWAWWSSDGLRNDLPRVTMVRVEATEASSDSSQGDEQVIDVQVSPTGNDARNEYTATGTMTPAESTPQPGQAANTDTSQRMTGHLLSHDSEYWYVIGKAGQEGNIQGTKVWIVPVGEASKVRIKPQVDKVGGLCNFWFRRDRCDKVGLV